MFCLIVFQTTRICVQEKVNISTTQRNIDLKMKEQK